MYTISEDGWLLLNGIKVTAEMVLLARDTEKKKQMSRDPQESMQATENLRVIDNFLYDCMSFFSCTRER